MAHRTVWERGAVALNGVAAGLFGTLSALRGKRVFHPDGDAYEGTATFLGRDEIDDMTAFLAGKSTAAVVRFSRGIGLPQATPDVLGMAVKLVDLVGPGTDQDLLLVTSGEGAVLQNTLRPARGFFRGSYSSVLPYRAPSEAGEQILFGAKPDPELGGSADETFRDLGAAVAVGRLRFDLMTARIGDRWRKLGTLVVTSKLDPKRAEALRFNPWNCHPDLVPAGPLNEWRRSAYDKSQAARPLS